MIRFAVIGFPGTTGESEAARAFQRNGMEAETVLWNDPGMLKRSRLDDYDGYCFAGGMSFGDRGRAGVIAAHQPIMDAIQKEADRGKVVLGIGNGAAILVESGLVPGYGNHGLACAVSPAGSSVGSSEGWRLVRNVAPKNRSAFNRFAGNLRLPLAPDSGRFVFGDAKVLEAIRKNDQIIFRYGDQGRGGAAGQGSESIAALCNPSGNVLAMLAHPERDPQGGGDPIFRSVREWIETRSKTDYPDLGSHQGAEEIRPFERTDLEFIVRPMSVDSERQTLEGVLRGMGFKARLKRYTYWSLKLGPGSGGIEAAEKILGTGEFFNPSKEWVYARIGGKAYQFSESRRLQPIDLRTSGWLVVADKENRYGNEKLNAIRLEGVEGVESILNGVLWEVEKADEQAIYDIIRTKILYNQNSMFVMRE